MRTLWNLGHTLTTGLGGILGWLLGGADGFILALVAVVTLDYITGIIAAYTTGQLSSAVGFRGIARKVMIFTLVGVANLLDVHILGEAAVLRTATIFFYLANEGLSIVENATLIGLPVPDKLRDALATITTKAPAGGRHRSKEDSVFPPQPPAPPEASPPDVPPPAPHAGGISIPPTNNHQE